MRILQVTTVVFRVSLDFSACSEPVTDRPSLTGYESPLYLILVYLYVKANRGSQRNRGYIVVLLSE